MKIYVAKVTKEYDGLRLDKFLPIAFNNFSRSFCRKVISWGGCYVNNKRIKILSYPVQTNDVIELCIFDDPNEYQFKEIKFQILYNDPYFIIVNKPANVVTQATRVNDRNHLLRSVKDWVIKNEGIKIGRKVRNLHRLDYGTSGVLIFSKSPKTYGLFNKPPKPEKIYLAVAKGKLNKSSGIVKTYIVKDDTIDNRYKISNTQGKLALTRFRVWKKFKDIYFVLLKPITGRTHQLRLHLIYLGCKILGDDFYGGDFSVEFNNKTYSINRLMLHCYKIRFLHPVYQKWITVKAPIPEEFNDLFTFLSN